MNIDEYRRMVRNAVSPAISSMTDVDARVRGGLMTMCEFAGNENNPDNTRKCKYYEKASHHNRCMYYRDETGVCDCIKN